MAPQMGMHDDRQRGTGNPQGGSNGQGGGNGRNRAPGLAPAPAGADRYVRPEGVTDEDVRVAGKMSEALEWVERARGHLYEFHQLMGHADALFGETMDALRAAGRLELAEAMERDLVGRDVLADRWTFHIVDEFDEGYYGAAQQTARRVTTELCAGHRHLLEAEMRHQGRTVRPGGSASPD